MVDRSWIKNGPRVLGYEPGWLWWAALVVAVAGGLFWGSGEWGRQQRNRAYLEERAAVHATEQGLDVALVFAVIEAESGWDWQAVSPLGAKGLMQVMPIALEDVQQRYAVGAGDLLEVDFNLRVGTLYLAYLLDRFEGDVALAVAAYHMGPTRVAEGQRLYPGLSASEMIQKHGGPQTRAYVKKVMGLVDTQGQ